MKIIQDVQKRQRKLFVNMKAIEQIVHVDQVYFEMLIQFDSNQIDGFDHVYKIFFEQLFVCWSQIYQQYVTEVDQKQFGVHNSIDQMILYFAL